MATYKKNQFTPLPQYGPAKPSKQTSSFYVNGIQVAKNTTNFPSGLNKFAFGVGTNTSNGTSSYSAFNFSVEI